MSKKDYNNFARMIRIQRHIIKASRLGSKQIDSPSGSVPFDNGLEVMLINVINELVNIFETDNPEFDADKFIKACNLDTISQDKE